MKRSCLVCGEAFEATRRGLKKYCAAHSGRAQIVKRDNAAFGKDRSRKYGASEYGHAMRQARQAHERVGSAGDVYEMALIMRTQHWSCVMCGKDYDFSHQLDHILPIKLCEMLSLDDANGAWNLQQLCKSCHIEKSKFDRKVTGIYKRENGYIRGRKRRS